MADGIRKTPCEACPYRRDAPSGVWSWEEYEKLRPYDAETAHQPQAGFSCHATPRRFCHGWAVVAGTDSLALRIASLYGDIGEIPPARVPLFETHGAAADHGQRDIDRPSRRACDVMDRLTAKHGRLRS